MTRLRYSTCCIIEVQGKDNYTEERSEMTGCCKHMTEEIYFGTTATIWRTIKPSGRVVIECEDCATRSETKGQPVEIIPTPAQMEEEYRWESAGIGAN
jgi:hypothetical protein